MQLLASSAGPAIAAAAKTADSVLATGVVLLVRAAAAAKARPADALPAAEASLVMLALDDASHKSCYYCWLAPTGCKR